MDSNTAIGLGVFALIAVILGSIVRTFARGVAGRMGPALQTLQAQAATVQAERQRALAALRAAQAPRPARPAASPAPRSRTLERPSAGAGIEGTASGARHRHDPGYLLAPFRGGESLLRSIIVAEALGPPLVMRRPEVR